ncbi:hypothetical protein MSAN_00280900 [Mycena sanguinolenta]|uniref:Uncharacterized protein n=1 Tax=Mycena sanguinolenta TaxID=230812 RepID=A0A8H7DH06_9AGAR|nr:hypothetical protein MSAN_00280900 [Mycena sanguinolenta]
MKASFGGLACVIRVVADGRQHKRKTRAILKGRACSVVKKQARNAGPPADIASLPPNTRKQRLITLISTLHPSSRRARIHSRLGRYRPRDDEHDKQDALVFVMPSASTIPAGSTAQAPSSTPHAAPLPPASASPRHYLCCCIA